MGFEYDGKARSAVRRRILLAGVSLTALGGWSASLQAQPFPDRPLNIVVPAPPGGTTDLAARALTDELGKALGTSVIIQNKPGANGVVGVQAVLSAKPDGYTILMAFSGFHVVSPHLAKLPYDILKDLQPIAMVYRAPEVLAIRSSLEQIRTFQELVTYAKANPGKLTYASAGTGSIAHVGMELFKQITGIEMTHVPYKGTGQFMADLLGGQVDMVLGSVPPFVPHLQSGRLRALLLTSEKRQPAFPSVPTSAEVGLVNFGVASWFALYAHSQTPRPIVERISEDVRKVMSQPSFQQRAAEQGAEAKYMNPTELGAYTRAQYERWGDIIRTAGIKAD